MALLILYFFNIMTVFIPLSPSSPDPHFFVTVLGNLWMKNPFPSLICCCMMTFPRIRPLGIELPAVVRVCAVLTFDSQKELLFLVIRVTQGQTSSASVGLNILAFVGGGSQQISTGLGVKATLVSCRQGQSLITLSSGEGNVRLLGEWHLNQHYCYLIPTFFP